MITPAECAHYFRNDTTNWITSGDDTQYIIEKKESGEVVVIFAESNSKADWKNNLNFWAKPYKEMDVKYYVHRGFLRCWKLVRDEIMSKLKELSPTYITVSGWSYGGALATLCYEDVWFQFPELRDQRRLITFGSPRVLMIFNFRKIKERWDNSYRFTNGADLVTCVPFKFMLFRHVCKPIHIGDFRRIWRFFNLNKYHHIKGYLKTMDEITY